MGLDEVQPKTDVAMEEFDSAAFTEQLRVLSVQDQKGMDDRYVWKKDGTKEFSGYPETSDRCIARVAEAMLAHPDQCAEIVQIVDAFVMESKDASKIDLRGISGQKDKLHTLWRAEAAKSEFFQKVAVHLVPHGTSKKSSEISEIGAATAEAVDLIA